MVGRLVRGLGRFLWDFFIGDTPGLFLAVILAIGFAYALASLGGWAGVPLVAFVMAALGASLARAVKGS